MKKRKRPSLNTFHSSRWRSFYVSLTRTRLLTGSFILISIVTILFLVSTMLVRANVPTTTDYLVYGQRTSANEALSSLQLVPTIVPDANINRANSSLSDVSDILPPSSPPLTNEPAALVQITATPAALLPNATPIAIAQAEAQPRFVLRNGAVQTSVEDTLAVKQAIEDQVAEMASEGAFVISSNESGRRNDSPTVNMAIRVPVTRFDEMMDWLAAQVADGTTATRSETADDVTAEYIDLAARVQSLQAARDRLLELMQNAATTEELLLAEQQLTQRETEIEGLQGRLQYLSQSAQLSRIDITLTPYILSQPPDLSWRPAETTRRAYDALLNSGRNFLDFLILFVIVVLPWLIIAALLLTLIYRFVWRPLRARRQ